MNKVSPDQASGLRTGHKETKHGALNCHNLLNQTGDEVISTVAAEGEC